MVEQNKRKNLSQKFREVAKLGKASDNNQSCRDYPFWYDLFKNLIARVVSDKVNYSIIYSLLSQPFAQLGAKALAKACRKRA